MTLRPRRQETPVPWGKRAITINDQPTNQQLLDSSTGNCFGCGNKYKPTADNVLHHTFNRCREGT